MRQLMGQLSPMAAPQGPDMGGLLGQGLKMFLDKQNQGAQDAKMQAMINALRAPAPTMPGSVPMMGSGMFGMNSDQAMPMSAIPPTGY